VRNGISKNRVIARPSAEDANVDYSFDILAIGTKSA
jgi:hypothetical protein